MITIGFTGSRYGMSPAQLSGVTRLLDAWCALDHVVTAVHGGCLGSDEEFHRLALARGVEVHVRPSTLTRWNAPLQTSPGVIWYPPRLPLVRNRDIVTQVRAAGGVMIACPDHRAHSGTRRTANYARCVGVEVTTIVQDGFHGS